jgi:hypothetical protein
VTKEFCKPMANNNTLAIKYGLLIIKLKFKKEIISNKKASTNTGIK